MFKSRNPLGVRLGLTELEDRIDPAVITAVTYNSAGVLPPPPPPPKTTAPIVVILPPGSGGQVSPPTYV